MQSLYTSSCRVDKRHRQPMVTTRATLPILSPRPNVDWSSCHSLRARQSPNYRVGRTGESTNLMSKSRRDKTSNCLKNFSLAHRGNLCKQVSSPPLVMTIARWMLLEAVQLGYKHEKHMAHLYRDGNTEHKPIWIKGKQQSEHTKVKR